MSEWKEVRLGDVIEIIGGGTPKTTISEYWDGNIPWLSVVDFNDDNRKVYITEKTITTEGLKNSSTKMLNENDIIISARGTIGAIAQLGCPMAFNQSCYGLRGMSDIDNTFLYYLLKTKIAEMQAKSHGSVFNTITRNTFYNIITSLPSLETQKKIASVLSALDEKIELNNKINKDLEDMAQAIFKNWFVDFEPFKDEEFIESDLGKIPKSFHIEPLSNLCTTVSTTHEFKKEKLIFLNTGDVTAGIFHHNKKMDISIMPGQAKKSILKHDILYSEIRPVNKHFAYVNFDAHDYVVSTKFMVIRAKDISSRRLYQFLTSQDVITELQVEAESRSGTFPQIRFENIANLKMLIANKKTEEDFAKILHEIYSKIDTNIQENQRLSQIRDTLLPRLMSGEIDVEKVED